MLHFQYTSLIDAPLERVWHFHERTDILQILTPPWQPVKIIRHQGGLEQGAVSEFRIFLGLIEVPWVSVHVEYQKYSLFTEQQTEGPMKYWHHRHLFSEENGLTRLTDSIAYEIPGGSSVEFFLEWWVNSRLQEMFRYRHQATTNFCSK